MGVVGLCEGEPSRLGVVGRFEEEPDFEELGVVGRLGVLDRLAARALLAEAVGLEREG